MKSSCHTQRCHPHPFGCLACTTSRAIHQQEMCKTFRPGLEDTSFLQAKAKGGERVQGPHIEADRCGRLEVTLPGLFPFLSLSLALSISISFVELGLLSLALKKRIKHARKGESDSCTHAQSVSTMTSQGVTWTTYMPPLDTQVSILATDTPP